MGMKPEEIVKEYPPLRSVYDVYAALVYWNDHKDEIEAVFEEDRRIGEQIDRDREEALKKRSAPASGRR